MTQAVAHRLKSSSNEQGFTLVEILVAGIVMVVGFIFIAQMFTSSAARILTSDTRSLMSQVATQQIEKIRGMQYQDVGTVGGQPSGLLPDSEIITSQGRDFLIVREVTYITDSSYSGPFPANYRRATVKVYLTTSLSSDPVVADTHVSRVVDAVVMNTNVAGGALGGTLDIAVTDLSGEGVPNAQLVITDNLLSPHVLINAAAIRTDADGKLMVPGLTPDPNGGYNVRASKSGYNSAELKQTLVVNNGTPYSNAPLTIDRLATLRIHLTDQAGTPLSGVALKVTGYQTVSPWTFTQNVTTDASGLAVLSDIRYSTSKEPYFIELVTPQNPPLRLPTGVEPPGISDDFIPLPAGKIPVLLAPGETQDVSLVLSSGPAVTSVTPNQGTVVGGNNVVIRGVNFTGATAVRFGPTDAISFVVNSATQITAVAPPGTGAVDITVTTPIETSATTPADLYTYQIAAPTVTGVSPSSGTRYGGTTVTVTGTNFTGATAVNFGGTNASNFTVLSSTQIRVVTPAHSWGTVDVRVTTPGGTSPTNSSARFTYNWSW
jgi:type II secretory pathway pseudopilin PulG